MGKNNNVIINFLSDKRRFADMINAELYGGYLLWVYHGEEEWDGPRTLKDMMDFGDDHDGFSKVFRNYEPQLLCINEMHDTEKYQTELKALFELLRLRSDKKALKNLVTEDERYNKLDQETYETAAVLMNAPSLLKKKQEYSDSEGRAYNMCKALRDWEAEIREESAEEIKKKDAELEKQAEELDALEKENAMLRAKLEAAGLE